MRACAHTASASRYCFAICGLFVMWPLLLRNTRLYLYSAYARLRAYGLCARLSHRDTPGVVCICLRCDIVSR